MMDAALEHELFIAQQDQLDLLIDQRDHWRRRALSDEAQMGYLEISRIAAALAETLRRVDPESFSVGRYDDWVAGRPRAGGVMAFLPR
jgi:hypothetical protein